MPETVKPPIFISHGAPLTMILPSQGRDFLLGLGAAYDRDWGRPEAILCVSAHWETDEPTLDAGGKAPEVIYDFYGFPDELYQMGYPAPGAPALAERAAAAIKAAGISASVHPGRGLDHGAWVPLKLMYPDADVPVAQLSIQPEAGPRAGFELGRALTDLRAEGVMILASGGAVHNVPDAMQRLRANRSDVPDWARAFDDWLCETVEKGDLESLLDYRRRAPEPTIAHPRDEHLIPIYVALGAAGEGVAGTPLHRSFDLGSISMAAYLFA